MSNAAVVKLQRKRVAKDLVWLDDNFGESIHLHINDFRADMTCEEFAKLHRDLRDALDDLIEVDGFRSDDYDGVFLEQMLWKQLLKIESISIDEVNLSDLWVWGRVVKRINKSRIYKVLDGDNRKAEVKKTSDHISQSGGERINQINESIQANGYDESQGYIVVYGNDNVIRDGQHRACSLYHQFGDIKVKVLRLQIKGYKDINTSLKSNPVGMVILGIGKVPKEIKGQLKTKLKKAYLKKVAKNGYDWYRKQRRKMYSKRYASDIRKQESVFLDK